MVDKPRDPTDFSDLEAKENERRKAMGLPPLPKRTWKHMSKYTEEDIEEYMAEVRETAKTLHRDQKKQMAYVEKSRRNLLAQVYGSALNKKVKPKPTDKVVIVGPSGAASATVEDIVESVVSTREKARERDLDEAVTAAIEGKTKGGKKKKVKEQKFDKKSDTFEGDVFRQAFPMLSKIVETLSDSPEKVAVKNKTRQIGAKTQKLDQKSDSFEGDVFKQAFPMLSQVIESLKGNRREGGVEKSREFLRGRRTLSQTESMAESLKSLTGEQKKSVDLLGQLLNVAKGLRSGGATTSQQGSGSGGPNVEVDLDRRGRTSVQPKQSGISTAGKVGIAAAGAAVVAGGAYAAYRGLSGGDPQSESTPAAAPPAVSPSTAVANEENQDALGRQFLQASEETERLGRERAEFEERHGTRDTTRTVRPEPGSNIHFTPYQVEAYSDSEVQGQYQQLSESQGASQRQMNSALREAMTNLAGPMNQMTGRRPRVGAVLVQRYGYTEEQLRETMSAGGFPAIERLLEQEVKKELRERGRNQSQVSQSTAQFTAETIAPTEPPAPVQEAVTPAAAAPRISSGSGLSRVLSRITGRRQAPVMGEGAGAAAVDDAGSFGLEQQTTPAPAAAHSAEGLREVEDVVKRTLNADRQSNRLEEVMNHFKQLYAGRRLPDNYAIIQRRTREYLDANPGQAQPIPVVSGEPDVTDFARPISDRKSDSESLAKSLDPSTFMGSDLLLKARKVTFKGDEIEFLSGSSPMGKGSAGGFGGPPMFGGAAPSTGGGGQVEGGGSQAMPGGEQTGDTSSLTFAPGVDPRIKKEVAQKIQQVESVFGKKLTITSGFRDQSRNAAAGGAKNSAHTRANAVDIRFSGNEEDTVKLIEAASAAGIGGIGVYRPGWLHLDTESKRVWGPDFSARSVPEWAKPALEAHLSGKQQDGQAVGTEAPTPSMSAEPSAAGGGAGGGEGSGSAQLTTDSASAAGSAPTDGIQVATASQENAMAERTPTAPSVVIPETPTTGQGSPGSAMSATLNSPDDPGPIEPPDAAERYAMLFNMAA